MTLDTYFERSKKDKEHPFVMIPKSILKDNNISLAARAVLFYLLSLPDNWRVNPQQVAATLNINKETMYRYLKELITHAYCQRVDVRDKGKKLCCVYRFSEEPMVQISEVVKKEEFIKTVRRTEKPYTVLPYTENADINNTQTSNDKDNNNTSDPSATSDNLCSEIPPIPLKGGVSPASGRLASFLFDTLKKISPDMKIPSMITWSRQMDLIMRVDGRSEEDLRKAINFILEQHNTATSEFTWSKAIRSPDKLRKHYDSLVLQMNQKPSKPKDQKSIKETLIQKGFKNRSTHNGATCYLTDEVIAFERGMNHKTLVLKEKGFWDQFRNLLSHFGIQGDKS